MREFSGAFRAESGIMFLKKLLKFLVNGIGDKSNANMRFNTLPSVMINRSDPKIGL